MLVLGAGRVGSAIARDLAADPAFSVTAADCSETALAALAAQGVATAVADFKVREPLATLMSGHELVVGAVPGSMGFETLRRVIEAGRDVVDISFFSEDPFELNDLARERGVRAVVDGGLAPGLSNLILGHHEARLDGTDSFVCLVGGLPADRAGVWEYKAPFSPADVLQEYTRPVRLRRCQQEFLLPALDEVERVEVPGVGTLEAFLTDGLRTLLRTSNTPTLVEKTLRYPGHAEKVKLLRESGFLSTTRVDFNGASVRPIDLSVRLLSQVWRFAEREDDLTVMRVEVVGRENGERVRHVYELLDHCDSATRTSSMARTTGYTCTSLVRWLAAGGWTRAGVAAPELLARGGDCLDFVVARLAERGVALSHRVEPAGAAA